MQNNRELKIAIIVGAIMITTCLLVIIYFKSDRNTNLNQVELTVYKANKETKKYEQCKINTDTLIQINSEFKKINKLTEKDQVKGKIIQGLYGVKLGNKFIAFDNEEDARYVYRKDTKHLYYFDSKIYSIVAEACQ